MYTPQEQKDAIKEAIDLTNDIPLATIDPGTEIPKDIRAKSGHPEILYQVIADVSFKLYIIHHTKTDKDFYKLHDYCFILDMLKSLYYEEYNKNISTVVCQIKYAYPLIGDDPVLREFVIALSNILQNRSFHVGIFFVYAMKITNYLAGIPLAAHKLINNTKMHSARSIQSRTSWEYIEPIFKECADQIGPNFTPREIGKLFNQFFYEKKGGKLETLLKAHGDWDKPKTKDGEEESVYEVTSRMRKNYFKDFNSWLGGREKAQRAFEIKITESLEDTLWNKQYMDQFASPFLKQFPASDISSDEMDEFTNQLQEFAKGITLE